MGAAARALGPSHASHARRREPGFRAVAAQASRREGTQPSEASPASRRGAEKALEQIGRANGLSPFDTGYRFEQFALLISSGFERLAVIVCDDRDGGALR